VKFGCHSAFQRKALMRPKKSDKVLSSFGQSVRAYRTAAGLTQEQLAEAAGLHVGFLGTVERGEKNISLLNVVAIAVALSVAPSELLRVLDVVTATSATSQRRNTAKK
jgi:transcriptional regulator with XRE-family HTH domain